FKTPGDQNVSSGSTVTWTIKVSNTGNVTLTNVQVADVLAPDCVRSLGTLTPGQEVIYTCSLANVTAELTNTAIASGTPPSGPNVTSTANAHVSVNSGGGGGGGGGPSPS